MVKNCCVKGCKETNNVVHYFKFPTSRTLKTKWLKVVKTTAKVTVHSLICSQHFSEDDYESVRGKVRLKSQVVPSIYKGVQTVATKPDNSDKITCKRTENNETHENGPNNDIDEENSRINHMQVDNDLHETDEIKINKNVHNYNDGNITEKERVITVNNRRDSLDSLEELNRHINSDKIYTCNSSSDISQESKVLEPDKQDIEEILTHYQIQQNHKLISERSPELKEREYGGADAVPPDKELLEVDLSQDTKSDDPVFIEISVDHNSSADGGQKDDCLMLLENVQVDIDPTTLMLPERDPDDVDEDVKRKSPDPISLLTSSDESDVIIEEPKIDIVEVSDEDEDDIPLVKLVKNKRKSENNISKLMWGAYDYYCVQCKFKTMSSSEYHKHCKEHSTAVQICHLCNYTTASKTQYSRHKRKHREERNFKCPLCDYKARHKFSLVYHLQSHSPGLVKSKKKYKCDKCTYSSDRKSDLNRHRRRCHTSSSSTSEA